MFLKCKLGFYAIVLCFLFQLCFAFVSDLALQLCRPLGVIYNPTRSIPCICSLLILLGPSLIFVDFYPFSFISFCSSIPCICSFISLYLFIYSPDFVHFCTCIEAETGTVVYNCIEAHNFKGEKASQLHWCNWVCICFAPFWKGSGIIPEKWKSINELVHDEWCSLLLYRWLQQNRYHCIEYLCHMQAWDCRKFPVFESLAFIIAMAIIDV